MAEDTSEEARRWIVSDTAGEPVLSLSVRPDQDMYKASPPLTPIVIPQGQIPGVLDKLGPPALAAVAASPGQCTGCETGVLYGMTSTTGADPVFGDLQWGEGHLLSFTGGQVLGPNTEVDMAAEAEEFVTRTRFRTQILPIIQSLTATPAPASGASTARQMGMGLLPHRSRRRRPPALGCSTPTGTFTASPVMRPSRSSSSSPTPANPSAPAASAPPSTTASGPVLENETPI